MTAAFLRSMRRLLLASLLLAVSGCRCSRQEPEPARETEARTLVEGTRRASQPPPSPEESRIVSAAELATTEVPPPELQACDVCEGGDASAKHCTACRNGERCVQSLLDPAWAVLADDAGDDLYLYQQEADGGELTWKREHRLEAARADLRPLLARHRNFPSDLERYVTLVGACPPVGETVPQSIAAYFQPAFEGSRPEVVEMKTSAKEPSFARATVKIRGNAAVVYLRRDDENCDGWRVMLFGFEGCPAPPPSWPEDLR